MNAENVNRHDRQVAVWLLLCCLMVFSMVVLGGVTRLTGSGLSMVQWDPIFGIVPPLNDSEWSATFDLYKQSPEYPVGKLEPVDLFETLQVHPDVDFLVLGRTIGTVFLLPFLYFLFRGYLRRPLIPKLAALFVLGGLQGLLGWYMVKSGLVDNPHVSQYRLTAHLGLAVVIYAWMLHIAVDLWYGNASIGAAPAALRRLIAGLALLVFITILSGGFVAGLKAGHAYNTFPLMDGHWIPEVMFMLDPAWRNFFENIATVQFDHRVLAMLVFAAITVLWLSTLRRPLPRQIRTGMHLLMAAAALQVTLGISTLLLHVPVALAATHQAGALLLFTVIVFLYQRTSRTGNARD